MLSGNYIFSWPFVLLVVVSFLGLVLSALLFRIRKSSSAIFLGIWTLASSIWSVTYAFEYAATDVALKIFWSKLSYFGIAFCPVSFFFFTLAFSSRNKLIQKKYIYILYGWSVLYVISALTNDWHHLHWRFVDIYPELHTTEYEYGPLFWVFYIVTYTFLIAGIVNLYFLLFRFSSRYKSQISNFILATIIPVVGNLMYVFNCNPVPGFDWTPLGFIASGFFLSINMFRYRVFDLIPFARNKLFDVMPDAVLVIDKTGKIADCNPALLALSGLNEKGVIGKTWDNLFPSWDLSTSCDDAEHLLHFTVESIDDSEKSYFAVQCIPLFDDNKRFSGNLINIRNISMEKKAENELCAANERLLQEIAEKEMLIVDLDAFAHTVAHDLKNMLGAIIMSGDLLTHSIETSNKKEAEEILDLIKLSSRKTLHVTHELLLLASVRQQEIRTNALDMSKIVGEAIQRNYNLIEEKGAELKQPKEYIASSGYAPWIEEVWVNYISNAIKYGGERPVIEFGSEKLEDDRVKYWVKDNGNGVPLGKQGLLFHKFTRLENIKVEGHGLGLSIVRRIVEKLGGTVGVESSAVPGEGALFYFILPIK